MLLQSNKRFPVTQINEFARFSADVRSSLNGRPEQRQ